MSNAMFVTLASPSILTLKVILVKLAQLDAQPVTLIQNVLHVILVIPIFFSTINAINVTLTMENILITLLLHAKNVIQFVKSVPVAQITALIVMKDLELPLHLRINTLVKKE